MINAKNTNGVIYKRGNVALGVEHLPDRAKGVITKIKGNEHTILATFTNADREREFKEVMHNLFKEY